MTTKLIAIGNSRGVRLPKAVLEQAGLPDEIELLVERNQITLRGSVKPRQGWADACRRMNESGDDALLDEAQAHDLSKADLSDWTW